MHLRNDIYNSFLINLLPEKLFYSESITFICLNMAIHYVTEQQSIFIYEADDASTEFINRRRIVWICCRLMRKII